MAPPRCWRSRERHLLPACPLCALPSCTLAAAAAVTASPRQLRVQPAKQRLTHPMRTLQDWQCEPGQAAGCCIAHMLRQLQPHATQPWRADTPGERRDCQHVRASGWRGAGRRPGAAGGRAHLWQGWVPQSASGPELLRCTHCHRWDSWAAARRCEAPRCPMPALVSSCGVEAAHASALLCNLHCCTSVAHVRCT